MQATVSDASASNPGIPPSSLMSFLRVNASIQGVILNEFDQAYTNPYYGSRFDNGSQINPKAILGSAALLTAALHTLAGGQAADLKVRAWHSLNPRVTTNAVVHTSRAQAAPDCDVLICCIG